MNEVHQKCLLYALILSYFVINSSIIDKHVIFFLIFGCANISIEILNFKLVQQLKTLYQHVNEAYKSGSEDKNTVKRNRDIFKTLANECILSINDIFVNRNYSNKTFFYLQALFQAQCALLIHLDSRMYFSMLMIALLLISLVTFDTYFCLMYTTNRYIKTLLTVVMYDLSSKKLIHLILISIKFLRLEIDLQAGLTFPLRILLPFYVLQWVYLLSQLKDEILHMKKTNVRFSSYKIFVGFINTQSLAIAFFCININRSVRLNVSDCLNFVILRILNYFSIQLLKLWFPFQFLHDSPRFYIDHFLKHKSNIYNRGHKFHHRSNPSFVTDSFNTIFPKDHNSLLDGAGFPELYVYLIEKYIWTQSTSLGGLFLINIMVGLCSPVGIDGHSMFYKMDVSSIMYDSRDTNHWHYLHHKVDTTFFSNGQDHEAKIDLLFGTCSSSYIRNAVQKLQNLEI